MEALKECYDPEIPVNIVDLGLIYDIKVTPVEGGAPDDATVAVDMTLTAPGCPAHVSISEDVRRKLVALPGVKEAKVNMVWTPQWTPQRLSQAAREKLGIQV